MNTKELSLSVASLTRSHGEHRQNGAFRRMPQEADSTLNDQAYCHVLILYGKPLAGLRAARVFLQLQRRFANDCHLDQTFHSFPETADSWEADQMLRLATDADLIVLALEADEELSTPLRRWLERLPRNDQPADQVLILLDEEAELAEELPIKRRIWLIGLADRKNMDFLSPTGSAFAPVMRRLVDNWTPLHKDCLYAEGSNIS